MPRTNRLIVLGTVALGIALIAGPVLAGHGKAGLWDITTTVDMPNMPKVSAADMARMKQMGMQMPASNTMHVQHCMTEAEVNSDKPPQMHEHNDCKMTNMKTGNGTFSADMVCTGSQMKGTGHMQVTYDSATHYSGKMTFDGTSDGQPATMTNTFEGKWVSANCGNVKH